MTATAPSLTLNNGVHMPAIGLGVFQTPPEETTAAVEAALATGYRHIDTAAAYGNEREVGAGIRRSGIDRSEVFIETKVWISDYGYDATLQRSTRARASSASTRSTYSSSTSRCRRRSIAPSTPTERWKHCSPTDAFARSESATSSPTTSTRC